jgi:predicted ABC-type ATPase
MQRVQQGGHYVNPDTVKQRYINGLSLLKHYKDFPDVLILIDNLHGNLLPQLELNKGIIKFRSGSCKPWAQALVHPDKKIVKSEPEESIEEFRTRYKKGRGL